MAVYSKIVEITETDYPADPQFVLPFEPASITAQVMSKGPDVTVSFGDAEPAATLIADILSPGSFYDWTNQRWVKNIFMKRAAGDSSVLVQIIAEE